MSSTSNTPAVSGSGARTEVIASRKALRVTAPKQHAEDVLDYGSLTVPVWDANVVRYKAPFRPPISDKDVQDQIVRAIRAQLQGLLLDNAQESKPAKDFKLAVVFDHHQVVAASHSSAIIDVVCDTAQSCHALRDTLKSISVVSEYNGVCMYMASSVRSARTSELLPVLLSVTGLRREEIGTFDQALEVMAAPIGKFAGVLRVAVVGRGNGNEKELERVVLAYIKLSPSSMVLSYPELQHRRLDSFEWKAATGTQTVKVEYQDLNLACYQQYVAEHRESAADSPSSPPGRAHGSTTRIKKEELESPIKKEKEESPPKREGSESPIKKRKQGGT